MPGTDGGGLMATCKGCGAQIVWIKTPGGKSMPCDPEPVVYWEREGAKGKVVTLNGIVHSADLDGDPDNGTGIGFIPHWATCPKAGVFKGVRAR